MTDQNRCTGTNTGIRPLRLVEEVLEEVQVAVPGACMEAPEAQSAQSWRMDYCFL